MMKDCVLFLPGRYPRPQLEFYRSLCRGRFCVAVDGGLRFFKASGHRPDLIIGDLDSVGRLPSKLLHGTRLIVHPRDKGKTDTELAVEFCLRSGSEQIEIVVPETGEPDHFLGIVDLLRFRRRTIEGSGRVRAGVINLDYELLLAEDEELAFRECQGDVLSVLPAKGSVRLSCRGTEFDVADLTLRAGECRGLRNRIRKARAVIGVQGRALIFHRFGELPRRGRWRR